MKKIRAYILHSSKMIKRGQTGYEPHQEQAKEDITLDGHVGQDCIVEVKDETLRRGILDLCQEAAADAKQQMLVSLDIPTDGLCRMTLYAVRLNSNIAMHHTVSTFVSDKSELALAWKILDMLIAAQE